MRPADGAGGRSCLEGKKGRYLPIFVRAEGMNAHARRQPAHRRPTVRVSPRRYWVGKAVTGAANSRRAETTAGKVRAQLSALGAPARARACEEGTGHPQRARASLDKRERIRTTRPRRRRLKGAELAAAAQPSAATGWHTDTWRQRSRKGRGTPLRPSRDNDKQLWYGMPVDPARRRWTRRAVPYRQAPPPGITVITHLLPYDAHKGGPEKLLGCNVGQAGAAAPDATAGGAGAPLAGGRRRPAGGAPPPRAHEKHGSSRLDAAGGGDTTRGATRSR